MSGSEKLNLIIGLSIPSILAQITNVMMFFIDQAMVGSLGAEAPAAIGLVESSLWLFGGLAGATWPMTSRKPVRWCATDCWEVPA